MPTPPDGAERRGRDGTSTSAFGVSRRESHDSSEFYARFTAPAVTDDDEIAAPLLVDSIWTGDIRDPSADDRIADSSAALVVTSPPYFVGKEYEQAAAGGDIPGSYIEYLQMLHDVFEVCVAKLEPGGRIAVNVANLGRRPYRSLSADVTAILQDRLGLLLRGEVIWRKGRGANNSSAWGSWGQPSNPVMRDTTERVVVASKGRFDRARSRSRRSREQLPSLSTIDADEYMEASLDVWDIAPESATRVGHPAPFPVALPQRLIEMHTYAEDLVLDPFMGSGTTAVAAIRTGRRYVGCDTDPGYIETAEARAAAEAAAEPAAGRASIRREARGLLADSGWLNIRERVNVAPGIEMPFTATDRRGQMWCFDLAGTHGLSQQAGLASSDVLWRTIGRAAAARGCDPAVNVVALTVRIPDGRSTAAHAVESATGADRPLRAVIDVTSETARADLAVLAAGC